MTYFCLLNYGKISTLQSSAYQDMLHYLPSTKAVSQLHLLSAFTVSTSFQLLLCSLRTEEETTGHSSDIATKRRKMKVAVRNEEINKNKWGALSSRIKISKTGKLILRSTTMHITVIPSLQQCLVTINTTDPAADVLWTFTSDTEHVFTKGLLRQ